MKSANGQLVSKSSNVQLVPKLKLSNARQRNQPYSLFYEALWRVAEWLFVSNQLQVSTAVRVWLLRLFGAKIGSGCIVRPCRVQHPWHLTISDRCWIGEQVWIINPADLTIGSDSVISQGCMIFTGSHELNTMRVAVKPVVIGERVWLTARTIVMSGVSIDDDVVVSSGSVVGRSLSGPTTGLRAVYGGNPVRKLREVNNDEQSIT